MKKVLMVLLCLELVGCATNPYTLDTLNAQFEDAEDNIHNLREAGKISQEKYEYYHQLDVEEYNRRLSIMQQQQINRINVANALMQAGNSLQQSQMQQQAQEQQRLQVIQGLVRKDVYSPSSNYTNLNIPQNNYVPHSEYSSVSCGIKPIPQLGCQIGNCINGQWEQVCNSVSCGIKPIPRLGCTIGQCVNDQWEQICNSNSCGIKPIPQLGCRIGDCIGGGWQQICN